MQLIEREIFLDSLQTIYEQISSEGHCVFVTGEAGLGKTSLVKVFCKQQEDEQVYWGACDALFTPRPLAPLYDILGQMRHDLWPAMHTIEERATLFSRFFHELSDSNQKTIIVFEDIHWADEATLDFIKFLARRISRLKCLFILTYRDDEISSQHPLRNILGQLPPDTFTRLQLTPLSRQVVEKMVGNRKYSGEELYTLSGGNPFYVTEILATYNQVLPDNIRDSILASYNRKEEKTRQAIELLSVIPNSFEVKYLERLEPLYASALDQCLELKVLIIKEGYISFKHELFRRTIETSLSPLKRVALHKKILHLLRESFEQNQEIERIVHHAKNANEYALVVQYAPPAARQAAALGAHIEAAKLYLSAIEYYQGNDRALLVQFYEAYAYECYLTNQIKEAIIYTGKALQLWKEKKENEKTGNCLRFLSRLWWFDGNGKQARSFASQAVEILEDQPPSRAKAMAFSNMSQLKLQSDLSDECLLWGEKAIAIARELDDQETVANALNSMGSTLMLDPSSRPKGVALLRRSMEIALQHSYHEHVARAYIEMGSNAIVIKDYAFATKELDEGIIYCEERDLDAMKLYMLGWKARLHLETGFWKEAYNNATDLLKNETLVPVIKIGALTVAGIIKTRRGDPDALPLLLEAKTMAFETMELQRMIPALYALLEYEWLTGKTYIEPEALNQALRMFREVSKVSKRSKFYYWLRKARKHDPFLTEIGENDEITPVPMALEEAAFWQQLGCPYEQALALFDGDESDKKQAIASMQELGASAVYEKMKQEMRAEGIKSIPRGIRKSTQTNPRFLTSRELEILQLLKGGKQNKEIADILFISAKTVDHHISAILSKLDVNTRAKAVHEALRLEIIK
ncbi:AAA family ATPase [Rhodocytophaga rosea]|uniref:AAA family ATPase n=1 Tax=Rhodocytophaga rosea TaxID=2704465 RepID=A0A6C0GQ93_9BACT|nr:helix-turn-helix transcriptional regulator [Rhodocytophaga rosea]QHT70245.1 AAA family ATPase [Rhodocytophaga rosea]